MTTNEMPSANPAGRFRYAAPGIWLKGNTHIHSTHSDGGKTPDELTDMYAGAGYDFLFRTDHWKTSDVAGETRASPLLWLDGVEFDGVDHTGAYYHVVCLGTVRGVGREGGMCAALEAARAQGALLVLAHPHWTGNTIDDAIRHGFDGVEAYNHVCRWLNGKSDGFVFWDALLERRPGTLGFAADDAHIRPEHPGWNGGWIVVRAAERSREAILAAIRAGAFYSSCGPAFHTIRLDETAVVVETSPVRFVRLVGPGSRGERKGTFEGGLLTEARFEIPAEWRYARIEIEDEYGARAWTNTLFAAP